MGNILFECKYCKRIKVTSQSGNTCHEKYCKENPNREIYKGHLHTQETKIKIGKKRKELIESGAVDGWHIHSNNNRSYPENGLKK